MTYRIGSYLNVCVTSEFWGTPSTLTHATSPRGWRKEPGLDRTVQDRILRIFDAAGLTGRRRIGQTKPAQFECMLKRASVTSANFNEAVWIEHLAAALEQVAAEAEPSYSSPPPALPGPRPIGERWSALHRGYRALAARAKFDPTASIQFKASSLWVNKDPAEAMTILREHPLIEPGLRGSGMSEVVVFGILNEEFSSNLKLLVESLAKLSVKEGGEEAARRLHRYLVAGANGAVPTYEITVIHGLVVKTRFNLDAGAYLAPYAEAGAEFGLPDEPEPLSQTRFPDAAVLVRGLEYGPGVVAPGDYAGLPDVQVAYRFPADYRVDLESWFDDRKLIVDLLSIATRVPLLSRTFHVRLAGWIEEMDPNFAFGTRISKGFISDVWPQGHELSKGDVDTFLELARGWHTYLDRPEAMNLALRRLATSFSRPGGRFGQEDRLLDVAIALEVLYGGTTGHKLSKRAAGLLGATAAEQKRTYDQAKEFYDARSRIVHWKKPPPSPDVLDKELEAGRNLACLTLASLLSRGAPLKWADVMRSLLPDTQAYIATACSQRNK